MPDPRQATWPDNDIEGINRWRRLAPSIDKLEPDDEPELHALTQTRSGAVARRAIAATQHGLQKSIKDPGRRLRPEPSASGLGRPPGSATSGALRAPRIRAAAPDGISAAKPQAWSAV